MVRDRTKSLAFAVLAMMVVIAGLYALISLSSYTGYIDDAAKTDACESAYGDNSTWVSETDGEQVVCTTADGVGLTDYERPQFQIGGWVDYVVSFGGDGE